jgi:single-strand DNA-binding protein
MAGMNKADEPAGPVNKVLLRGRLAAEPVLREMPSGDTLAIFRVTVSRPPGDRVRVDSIECTSAKSKVMRSLSRAQPGDELELEGCLQRRFWRTPAGGPASRYTVNADAVRVTKADRRAGASRARTRASA